MGQRKDDRLASLDAYRGLIMLTLAAAGFGLARTAQQFPESNAWRLIHYHFDHPEWISQRWVGGCSYWDLIQPAFLFMVGVSMPFSYGKRAERGESRGRRLVHAAVRSIVLILLGVFLASAWSKQTNWVFVNVLAQIGLGYLFVYAFLGRAVWAQLLGAAVVLVATWLAFVTHDVLNAQSLADHFQKHTNVAADVDVLFLGLFPRDTPLSDNEGGYTTLNFVPSAVTMLFGLMAGELLRSDRSQRDKLLRLCGSAIVCLALGVAIGYTICPVVKRIWTPSWTLYSGGYVLAILAGFYLVVDIVGWKGWTLPLRVLGANSILVYLMSQLLRGWTAEQLRIHFGRGVFQRVADWTVAKMNWVMLHFGKQLYPGDYSPIAQACLVLLAFWLLSWWLYRQRLFVRI